MMIDDDKKKQSQAPPVVPEAPIPAGVPSAASIANASADDLRVLIQTMLQRENRLAKIEEAEFNRKETRRLHYESTRNDDEATTLARQAACKHLKGGRTRRRNAAVDHDVYMFTFVTGETYIKCHGCKMKWRPTDTVKYVARNGKVYPNHTPYGWAEALDLAATSTNTAGRSEIPPSQFANVAKEVALPKTSAVQIDTNPVGDAAFGTV